MLPYLKLAGLIVTLGAGIGGAAAVKIKKRAAKNKEKSANANLSSNSAAHVSNSIYPVAYVVKEKQQTIHKSNDSLINKDLEIEDDYDPNGVNIEDDLI